MKQIVEDRCTGCGTCVESCPMDVFRLHPTEPLALVAYPGDCIVCYNCERDCPSDAIIISPERAKPMPAPW